MFLQKFTLPIASSHTSLTEKMGHTHPAADCWTLALGMWLLSWLRLIPELLVGGPGALLLVSPALTILGLALEGEGAQLLVVLRAQLKIKDVNVLLQTMESPKPGKD